MSESRYTVAKARAFAARVVDRASWYSGGAIQQARIAVRSAIAAAGLPLAKEYLELQCAKGNEASGLFSEFCAVIGCLDHFERHRTIYEGLRVDFGRDGLYYEAASGWNWWEYYFEPIQIGDASGARITAVPLWQHDYFAERVEQRVPRDHAAEMLARYIRVKPDIHAAVDAYCAEYLTGDTIGIHYRGTDKSEESPVVPYGRVAEALRAVPDDARIFVATDEQAFLDYLMQAYPGRVIFRPMYRSQDRTPLHKSPGHGRAGGRDAVIDCLILARCNRLIRTASNLGLVAGWFKPHMPIEVVRA